VLAGLAAALWFPKSKRAKIGWAALVLGLASIPIFKLYSSHKREQEIQALIDARYIPAKAMFEEKCKTAGEVVHRRVEGVEAVYLIKGRPLGSVYFHDIMSPGIAALGDSEGKEYIDFLLRYESATANINRDSQNVQFPRWPEFRGTLGFKNSVDAKYPGYQYVVARDEADGQLYRYTLVVKEPYKNVEVERQPHIGPLPRYAVDYEDWMDPEIRQKYRLAGTIIKIIDQKTQEVIATKTLFLMDRGFDPRGYNGHLTSKDRCPDDDNSRHPTRFFVDQVLKPTREGN
jgi:hypothetical protein